MTSPNGAVPEGALGVGMFAARQAESEEEARARATNGAWKGSWNNAQESIKDGLAPRGYVIGEVGRLDNRIDEITYGQDLAQLATFSTSDVWVKPENCRKVVVIILGGASGGGRNNASTATGVDIPGLGGFSGGWTEAEYYPEDLPDECQVVVGAGGVGSSTNGAYGAPGVESSFNGVTAGGAGANAYGVGTKSFRIRGGKGGSRERVTGGDGGNYRFIPGGDGGTGSYAAGGRGATELGTDGESGFGVEAGQAGMGSGGGGGAFGVNVFLGTSLDGGRGGGGGWPSGPGGGGGGGVPGNFGPNSQPGNGGSGAGGAVFVISYLNKPQ